MVKKSSNDLFQGSKHSSRVNLYLLQVRYATLRDERNETDMKVLSNGIVEEIENNQSKCDVCLKETSVAESDELVLCDLCNCGVHQQCYRRELEKGVPGGDWFCERCTNVME